VPNNIARLFSGRNFMTPDVVRFGAGRTRRTSGGKTRYYELSKGRGLEDEAIFGVTVRDYTGARFTPDLSKVFQSRRAAEDYIATL
jgi:hypothetical protein